MWLLAASPSSAAHSAGTPCIGISIFISRSSMGQHLHMALGKPSIPGQPNSSTPFTQRFLATPIHLPAKPPALQVSS
ncbi:hypothetical protein EV2_006983 [Malus domestica]